MTRDELERCARFLQQGLTLDRETQVRLVEEAQKHFPPRRHIDGCAWWRGAGCDCEPEQEPLDLSLKKVLTS